MSIEAAIQRGRAAAEAIMIDACQIRRSTGTTTDANGTVTPTWDDLYEGKCRVQVHNEMGHRTDVGEASVVVRRIEVQLPISVTGLREGDQVEITASALDPDLVGKLFAVRDVLAKTHLTSRRLTVTEVTS